MPALSLVALAQKACIRNLPGINDVGEIPYDVIRPVLRKVTNPQQLHDLEVQSPHIADHDAELWRAFIARDIPGWQGKMIEPANPRSWWKVYKKMLREDKRAAEEVERQFSATMNDLSQKRDTNKAMFAGTVIPPPLVNLPTFVDGIPSKRAKGRGIEKPREISLKHASGAQVLTAIRKQSSSAALERQRAAARVEVPRYLVPNAKSQIKKAPEWMVQDIKKQVAPPAPSAPRPAGRGVHQTMPRIVAKKHATEADIAIEKAIRRQNEEKEARLRALTQLKSKITAKQSPTPPRQQSASNTVKPRPTTPSPPRVIPPRKSPPRGSSPRKSPPSTGIAVPQEKRPSPESSQPLVRKRSAAPVSIFMPAKKRKV